MEQYIDHGQVIYIIGHDEIDDVMNRLGRDFKKKMVNGNDTDYTVIHRKTIDFYKVHAESPLYLAYCYPNGDKEKELPYLLNIYKDDKGCQRFQFENARCLNCSAGWRVANPMYLGIYPNYDFNVSELRYPLLNCPECGGELSRPAIWCEKMCNLQSNIFGRK